MTLTQLDVLNGVLALAFVIISIFLGARIALKYKVHKDKNLLYIGLFWILMVSGW